MATTLERVQAGMDFLDERRPEWRGEIDRNILDLASQTDCILGQLYGHYRDALPALGMYGDRAKQAALGFEVTEEQIEEHHNGGRRDYYGDLTAAWEYLLDN